MRRILPALFDSRVLGGEPLVYCDKLNHASLIHGCLTAGVRQIRFRHNDLGHLEELLAKQTDDDRPRFIVTETVFSMDGDRADVLALARLADRYEAFLYLDEAHATGVLGDGGFGLAKGLAGPRCLVMGTFSKALGGFGAFVACTATLRDYLINRCSGLIYATALPPAVLGAMDAALDLVPGMDAERVRLAAHGERLRAALAEAGTRHRSVVDADRSGHPGRREAGRSASPGPGTGRPAWRADPAADRAGRRQPHSLRFSARHRTNRWTV